ncbi:MAG: hypothetical protein JO157_05930 [Acetobacteraceae bacterium]|nr:hypothetical protein [Acetobacteraceae bacterium]
MRGCNRRRHAQAVARRVTEFNAANPVGTPVRYWTGAREGEGRVSRIRWPAEDRCGTPVVFLDAGGGCIALTHIEPIRTEAPDA